MNKNSNIIWLDTLQIIHLSRTKVKCCAWMLEAMDKLKMIYIMKNQTQGKRKKIANDSTEICSWSLSSWSHRKVGFAIDALDFETQFSLVISSEMQGKAALFHLGHLAALQTTYLNI